MIIFDGPHVPAAPIKVGISRTKPDWFASRPKGMDGWQLLLTTRGQGQINHDLYGTKSTLDRSDIALFSPGVRQYYGNGSKKGLWEHQYFVFHPRPDWQRWLMWPEFVPGIRLLRMDRPIEPEVRASLQRCYDISCGTHPERRELAMCHLHDAIIRCYAAHFADDSHLEEDERVTRVINQICGDLKHLRPSVEEMAQMAGVSSTHLTRLFEKQFGQPPAKYLENRRIERAVELLSSTKLRVAEIATEVGYEDALYFSGRFREAMGRSPRQYRRDLSAA